WCSPRETKGWCAYGRNPYSTDPVATHTDTRHLISLINLVSVFSPLVLYINITASKLIINGRTNFKPSYVCIVRKSCPAVMINPVTEGGPLVAIRLSFPRHIIKHLIHPRAFPL